MFSKQSCQEWLGFESIFFLLIWKLRQKWGYSLFSTLYILSLIIASQRVLSREGNGSPHFIPRFYRGGK